MARETKEQMRERLENQNEELYKHIQKLIENGENSFLNSPTYNQMKREIEVLKAAAKVDELAQAKDEIKALKEQQPIKVHNARGAGRKPRFKAAEVNKIKRMYSKGKSMREIAEIMGCSVGLIHKLINE